MSAAMDMGVLKIRERETVPVLDAMIAAGWDDFEITIPFHAERPYKIFLFEHDGHWRADLENTMCGRVTEAESEGDSAGEALWKLTDPYIGGMTWPGEDKLVPGAIPARLMATAAVFWADAVEECAEEARSKATEARSKAEAMTDEAHRELRRARAAAGNRDNALNQLPEGAF